MTTLRSILSGSRITNPWHRHFSPANLWSRITPPDFNGCWHWLGSSITESGYGFVLFHGFRIPAHRFVYQLCKASIPPGRRLKSTCHNKLCVNPDHHLPGSSNPHHHGPKGRRGEIPV